MHVSLLFLGSEEEDNGDEDEEAELMKELERIKEEKAAAAAKKEREQRELADQINRESALKSNPLVSVGGLSGEALSAKVLPSSHRKQM